ncbi:MarR family winged helix-turn-helix transcriptional regulator [Maricaulis sp. MIT060901]|uniref:MarR family winged helix-turn-helix transcriptional regulator n=1 Tax=Maricaulis sp. MIT060901 TaxID=3096993 RepID=UPI00399B782A
MVEDFVASFGHTALGTRLKRSGMAMQAVVQKWLQAQGCELPSAQMPVLAALHFHSPRSTGELAQMLVIAQPGVSRLIDQMEKGGWVVSTTTDADRRVRRIALSESGKVLAARAAEELWPVIDAAVTELCGELEGSFIDQISALEERLAGGALDARLDSISTKREQTS